MPPTPPSILQLYRKIRTARYDTPTLKLVDDTFAGEEVVLLPSWRRPQEALRQPSSLQDTTQARFIGEGHLPSHAVQPISNMVQQQHQQQHQH